MSARRDVKHDSDHEGQDKTPKEGMKVGGSLSFDQDREAKVEAYKPPMFKGVYNAQDVEALLLHF